MLTKPRQPQQETAEPSDFEIARARYAEVCEKRRALEARHQGLKMALSLAANPGDVHRVPDTLKNLAHPNLKLARKRPEKVATMAADVRDELDELMATFPDEHERWQAAQRRETERVAGELQGRHRAAVTDMVKAVEKLSRAIDDERQVRAELARVAPLPTSARLPDLSAELLIGALGERDSPASNWARRLRKLGILKG